LKTLALALKVNIQLFKYNTTDCDIRMYQYPITLVEDVFRGHQFTQEPDVAMVKATQGTLQKNMV
jgi:hypothetical protein